MTDPKLRKIAHDLNSVRQPLVSAVEVMERVMGWDTGIVEPQLRAAIRHALRADAAMREAIHVLRGGWSFPLLRHPERLTDPLTSEQGAFGALRGRYRHTGVDLYTGGPSNVFAVEAGTVVIVERFTGPDMHPRWLETEAVLIEGPSGVVVYGEISADVKAGDEVRRGQRIGVVAPVLKEGAERPDIPGHSRYMLHIELHTPGTRATCDWLDGDPIPQSLLDPTTFLTNAS